MWQEIDFTRSIQIVKWGVEKSAPFIIANANQMIKNSRNFNDLMLYFILNDNICGIERGVPCDYKYSR